MISPANSRRWKRLSSVRRRPTATVAPRGTGVFDSTYAAEMADEENVGRRRDSNSYTIYHVRLPG